MHHIWNETVTATLITAALGLPIAWWSYKANKATKNNGGASMLDKIQATIRAEAEATREEVRYLKQDVRDVKSDNRELALRVQRLERQ